MKTNNTHVHVLKKTKQRKTRTQKQNNKATLHVSRTCSVASYTSYELVKRVTGAHPRPEQIGMM